jgi:rhodanese-related sulfurtransferase
MQGMDLASSPRPAVQVRFLQPVEVKAMLEDPTIRDSVLVLDVRDDDFQGAGHIRGCINIPSYLLSTTDELDSFITRYLRRAADETSDAPPIDTVVVHCYLSQQRGPTAARRLARRLAEVKDEWSTPEVVVLAHGWRRFHQLFGTDLTLCEY